ncbi:unnamed protein product [Effrenium voratum]|uniref:Uncharacterized protein n=1 Tax=Effrenium voratum TaxID=2562239 RepID=A0AA36HNG6_9DINO|nr:unnamed protein product [Effrenium voratum]CAJ1372410.1 unnamed protein product [Effrenium voratum]
MPPGPAGIIAVSLRFHWRPGRLVYWRQKRLQQWSPAVVSRAASVSARPSPFRESQEQISLSERQEAFLLERLPRGWAEDQIRDALGSCGKDLGADWREKILLMRSQLGTSAGRALIAHPNDVSNVLQELPAGTVYRPMDKSDVEAFVEQCERFMNLSKDLRRIAAPQNFLKILTITEVPPNYGRKDIAYVIKERCNVVVQPQDIVFRFKRWGRQGDTCYVVCPSVEAVDHCVQEIQELAVPKRAAHGSLFGAAFLWSSRATLFVSDPDLDFLLHGSKTWVCTTGWQEDMTLEEFLQVMNQLEFYPVKAHRHHIAADGSSAFFMKFDQMEGFVGAKRAMTRLRRLKWRWRIKQTVPFFAYARRVDVHRACEDRHEDELSEGDSDIDEPIHY